MVVGFYRREYRRAEGITRNTELMFSDQIFYASTEETDCRLSSVPNPRRDGLKFDFGAAIVLEFACLELTQRQTMSLSVEGVPYDQIAALNEASVVTVRSRMHYGKRKFRERLAVFR